MAVLQDKDKSYYDTFRNVSLKWFRLSEFDCPTQEGSGRHMDKTFMDMLEKAREIAQVPFIINSGYRTKEYNATLTGASKNSSHTNIPCNACDISAKDSITRYKILEALIKVGFNRIGIGKNFIHCDTDKNKSQEVVWHYY